MIDTEKVKLMTKIAVYEEGIGKKDLKMYRWKQENYVSLKILENIVCVTLCYLGLVAIYFVRYLSSILKDGFEVFKPIGMNLLILYGGVFLFTWIFSYFYYKRKYREARKRVARYDKDLYRLETYLKEENNNIEDDTI